MQRKGEDNYSRIEERRRMNEDVDYSLACVATDHVQIYSSPHFEEKKS